MEVRNMKIRLKEIREEKKITQEKLANLVGVTRQTIINIEKGKYKPTVLLALKISRVLNCRVEDLFILEEGDMR
ncbi:MAG: helix-turn-helix transcriptional regulator [Thermotogae bacterium]|nr:helix-turn-helix transcriptional regulator [Thermotogota bacterium]